MVAAASVVIVAVVVAVATVTSVDTVTDTNGPSQSSLLRTSSLCRRQIWFRMLGDALLLQACAVQTPALAFLSADLMLVMSRSARMAAIVLRASFRR